MCKQSESSCQGSRPRRVRDPGGELEPLHPAHDTFPGEVFLQLAADAIEEAGASRDRPIEFEGIRERYLPECAAHTKEQHYKSEFAIKAAAMIRAGVDPGLLDEAGWWRADDLWMWSLDAFVVYVRVAADRTGCRDRRDLRAARTAPRLRSRHAELSTERRVGADRMSCSEPHQSRRSVIQRLQVRPRAEELRPIRAARRRATRNRVTG